MNREIIILFTAKGIRTFCYGYLGVLFPIYLTRAGFDAPALGTAVTLVFLSSALFTLGVRRPAQRFGPAKVLAALAGLTTLSGVIFQRTLNPWLIVLAAMIGNIAVGMGESGPFVTLEQVVLARVGTQKQKTGLYSVYNLISYLAAALGALIVTRVDISAGLFVVFSIAGVLQAGLYLTLKVPVSDRPRVTSLPLPSTSRPLIRKLALLFSLDAFAGGFIAQSLVLYWFHVRHRFLLETLGPVMAAAQAITAVSYLMAPGLARRFGLANTMVFTHIFANLILIALPFAPTAYGAVGLLLFRHLFSQIDVPTRQAYLMEVVEDHEREAAASLTNTSRTLAQSVSPAITGWIMGILSLSAPFLLGGGLKIAYDVLLYVTIRKWEGRHR